METNIITLESIGATHLHNNYANETRLSLATKTLLPNFMLRELGKVIYTINEDKVIACQIMGFLCGAKYESLLRPTAIKVKTADGNITFLKGDKRYFRTMEDALAWYVGDKSKGFYYDKNNYGAAYEDDSRTLEELGVTRHLFKPIDTDRDKFTSIALCVGYYYWFDKQIKQGNMFARYVYVTESGIYFVKGSMADETQYLVHFNRLSESIFNIYYKKLYPTREDCLRENAPTIVDFLAPAEPIKEVIKVKEEPKEGICVIFRLEH